MILLRLLRITLSTSLIVDNNDVMNRYLLQALVQANRSDIVVDLLLQETLPSLGYQIAQGATTLWEYVH